MQVNRALTSLDLRNNGLSDDGAAAIGDALKVARRVFWRRKRAG